jgi:cystathionine beta-synthase
MGRDLPCDLIAKVEFMNPGGSVKDRPALQMVEEAERQGLLKPGSTIVEGTSGNTGIGLAIVAARRRYRCIFVMPDKMAPEKIALLRAYGAEVVVCPTAVAPDHPESYYSVTARLAEEIPGAFHPNQYANPANPLSHVLSTGPEIWRQTAGRITHFVAGIGTGGTISGVGRYLKSQNPGVRIIGADPEGSVYSGGSGRPYLVEGIGEDFWPTTYDGSVVDQVIRVSDMDSFLTARRLATEEGVLAGGSTGTAVFAALQLAPDLHRDDIVVVLIPDSGRGYLSRVYSDEWMADHGFLRTTGHTVSEALDRKSGELRGLIHVHPSEQARQAIAVMQEFGVSQLAVIQAEPPLGCSGGRRCRLRAGPHAAGDGGSEPARRDRRRGDGTPASNRRCRRADGRRSRAPRGCASRARSRSRPSGWSYHPCRRAWFPRADAGEPRDAEMTKAPSDGASREDRPLGFETLAIHAGQEPDPQTGAVGDTDPPLVDVRAGRSREARGL